MSALPIDKAVILARGLGSRMQRQDDQAVLDPRQAAAAHSGIKAMIPIGRPFLDYVLSALADAGYREACLVIGPEHALIRDYYTTVLSPTRIRVAFAIQAEPLGTADAVLAAEEFTAGEDFLVINSDNYYPVSALRALRALSQPGLSVFERESLVRRGNMPAERVRQYAVALVGEDGYLERIIEKPDEGTLDSLGSEVFVSMNCWRFSPAIFRACRGIPRSPRGEFELPDAVQYAISQLRERFKAVKSEEGVLDLSTRSDITAVADRLRGTEVRL